MKRLILLLFLFSALQSTGQFTSGNLVVFRIGNGTDALVAGGVANPAFLDEYTPSGTLVQSVPIPTTDGGGNLGLTSRIALTDGLINRSTDGRFIVITGYNSIVGNTASTGDKVVGLVDFSENINITTVVTSSNVISSAISDNGSNIWSLANNNRVFYNTLGSNPGTEITNAYGTSARDIKIFDGQLYVSTANSVTAVGSGKPTTATQPFNNLPGITGNFYQFMMFDMDGSVAGVDVLYVAHQSGGIEKYSLSGGTWVSNGTVATGAYSTGLTGTASGGIVNLYAVTNAAFDASGGGTIQSITDASGYNGTITATATTIATAPANTTFRGITFTPTQFALPVKFNAISAHQREAVIDIKWSTGGTAAIVDYIIERAADGRTFTAIGQVSSSGNEHLYSDVAPLHNTNFYRILSTESTGKKSYSGIVKITNYSKEKMFSAFPSPIKGSALTLQLREIPAGKYLVDIINSSGHVTKRSEIIHNSSNSSYTINVEGLKPGIYVVHLAGNKNFTQSIVIQ